MGKHLANFLRGMGSILEIAPNPEREIIVGPLYQRRGETPEHAIYRTWSRVGDSLISASGMVQIGEREAQESARSA